MSLEWVSNKSYSYKKGQTQKISINSSHVQKLGKLYRKLDHNAIYSSVYNNGDRLDSTMKWELL